MAARLARGRCICGRKPRNGQASVFQNLLVNVVVDQVDISRCGTPFSGPPEEDVELRFLPTKASLVGCGGVAEEVRIDVLLNASLAENDLESVAKFARFVLLLPDVVAATCAPPRPCIRIRMGLDVFFLFFKVEIKQTNTLGQCDGSGSGLESLLSFPGSVLSGEGDPVCLTNFPKAFEPQAGELA